MINAGDNELWKNLPFVGIFSKDFDFNDTLKCSTPPLVVTMGDITQGTKDDIMVNVGVEWAGKGDHLPISPLDKIIRQDIVTDSPGSRSVTSPTNPPIKLSTTSGVNAQPNENNPPATKNNLPFIPEFIQILHGVSLQRTTSICCGGFADIYLASWNEMAVALKRILCTQGDSEHSNLHQEASLKEAGIWAPLKHPYILPLLGIDTETFPGSICLITPWMCRGTLKDILSAESPSNSKFKELLSQVAQAVAHIHSVGIVHGDIRAANILINNDGHACVADFGLSNHADIEPTNTTAEFPGGSIRWMAPELLDETEHSKPQRTRASDVYAFGCLCVEVCTRQDPFPDIANDWAVILKVTKGACPLRHSKAACMEIPDGISQLVAECLGRWADERPNMKGVATILMRSCSEP